MIGYPLERLREEIAFLAFHFHWDYYTLLRMTHEERRMWCDEVSKINKKLTNRDERTVSIEDIF